MSIHVNVGHRIDGGQCWPANTQINLGMNELLDQRSPIVHEFDVGRRGRSQVCARPTRDEGHEQHSLEGSSRTRSGCVGKATWRIGTRKNSRITKIPLPEPEIFSFNICCWTRNRSLGHLIDRHASTWLFSRRSFLAVWWNSLSAKSLI
jgi:hypothetical protein